MTTTRPLTTWLLVAATVTTGLAAGLLYGFAVAVMPDLSLVHDETFVSVMQSINRSIVNPWFLVTFLGAPLLVIAALISHYLTNRRGPGWPLVIAAVLSVLSVLITATANIPLNDALDTAGSLDPTAVRQAFEGQWVQWNIIRAAVSTAAFGFLVLTLALARTA